MNWQEWALFFGHFHPLLVHLPIGMLIGTALVYWLRKGPAKDYALWFFISFLCAGLSCALGWGLSQSGEYEANALNLHQNLGLALMGLNLLLAYVFRYWSEDVLMAKTLQPLLILTLVVLTAVGHYGGNLTHGSDYLIKDLPSPFRTWVGLPEKASGPTEVAAPSIQDLNKALFYQDLVAPILKKKCWSCHNDQKQKGKLRMDLPEFLFKGGEHGVVLVAGNAEESPMLQRVLLSESDEDHMPPKGKPSLTSTEMEILRWWINEGADLKLRMGDLKMDADKKKILDGYVQAGTGAAALSPVFDMDLPALDEAQWQALRAKDWWLKPLAKDKHGLELSAVNKKQVKDEDLEDLKGLEEQLLVLKLKATGISDGAGAYLGDMPHLQSLDVSQTAVGDAFLAAIKDLPYLEVLNVYKTQVSDAGIPSLLAMKKLKRVYVWQSRLSPQGLERLKKAKPGLQVLKGFDGVWKLDTTGIAGLPPKNP